MKKVYYFWLILIVIISTSCVSAGGSYYYLTRAKPEFIPLFIKPVYIDKDYSEEDKAIIKKSLDEWNFVLNGMIIFKIKDNKFDMSLTEVQEALNNGGVIIFKLDSTSNLIHDGTNTKILGWADKLNGNFIYIVRDRLDKEFFHSVVLHEFGHILSAKHKDGTLMQAVSDKPYPCIDGTTALQVSAAQMIPFEKMNYCEWTN